MKNINTLKEIARKTKNLKHLADKNVLTNKEYMELCCTDEYQKSINKTLDSFKSKDTENWY